MEHKKGSIRLRKVKRIADSPVPTEGYIVINCLSWLDNNKTHSVNAYEVTPYRIKSEDGAIFENIWQSAKWYPKVYEQKALTKWDGEWNHPAEIHEKTIHDKGIIPTDEYWHWRSKLYNHHLAVRYPNGKQGASTCKCALWPFDDKGLTQLNYIEARWHIYVKVYEHLVKKTGAYSVLKEMINNGINLEFMDVDCPDSIEVTKETFESFLLNKDQRFGHTWVLAGSLLNLI